MTHEAKLEFLQKVTDYHQAQAAEILALIGHGMQETERERKKAYYKRMNDYILYLKTVILELTECFEKRQSVPRMNYDMGNHLSSSEETKKLYSLFFNDDEDHKKGEGPTNDRMAYSHGHEDEEFLKASVPGELDMIEGQEEDLEEEKDGESSGVSSLWTNSDQSSHAHELTSESSKSSGYQDSEVSLMHVEAHLNEMLTGQKRSFYQSGKYNFTLQRNCLRIFLLFVPITALVIIITICYMTRGNSIISTPKLDFSASKETQEFIQHRSGSRVLIPTKNDMQTEGKEKALGTTGSTKHAGSLRESKVITSISNTNAKLRIVIPIKKGFHEFIKNSFDTENNRPLVTGFVIDVFNEVMKTFPNQVSWEFIPYEASYKDATEYYDNLAHQINLKSQKQSYDVVVGDVTITKKRSKYGAFSHPFLSSEISMIMPIKDDNDVTYLWWFFKPLSAEMWIATFVFFLLKGVLLCLLEGKENQASQWRNFWSFLFARRWKLERASSRFIVDIWIMSLFIIGAAYNANISILLSNGTPEVINTDLETLIENGDNVGYPNGSFVFGLLKQWGFHESKLKAYSTEKEYVKALSLGSAKNDVSAIVDEIPYIRVFLARYGHQYAMGVLNRKIKGSFGFVFPKDSKIVHGISEGIVQLQEVGRITEIEEKWFEPLSCSSGPIQAPGSFKKLGFHQFRGLFLIAGLAILLQLLIWCYQHWKDNIIPQWENIKKRKDRRITSNAGEADANQNQVTRQVDGTQEPTSGAQVPTFMPLPELQHNPATSSFQRVSV